jgi:hypothetical protein
MFVVFLCQWESSRDPEPRYRPREKSDRKDCWVSLTGRWQLCLTVAVGFSRLVGEGWQCGLGGCVLVCTCVQCGRRSPSVSCCPPLWPQTHDFSAQGLCH